MTSLLQHGSSFGTTESNTISLRIVDEINFPKYAEIDIANLNGDRSATYSPHDEIRIIDDDVTGDPVIFRGRVENITTPTDAQFGSLVRITARDNLAELHMDFDNNTYSENGLDATLNAIIRGHSQQPISVYGIGLPAVDSNTANFESSSITGAWTVVGKNNTRTVLETLQDLVFEDPWGTTYQNTTNYGWNFYLDGDNNMHYHKLGAFPSAPSSNGLSVTYGLVTPNDYNKPMLPGASFDEIADDIITDVICHYNIGAVSYSMRLRRFTHGTVGGSGYPFAAGHTITGGTTGSTAVIQLVTSGALIVSNDNADEDPLEEFNNDSGSTDVLTSSHPSEDDGATATMVTTPSSEINGEVRLLELDPPDFHFSAATSQASAKQYVAQTASVYLKAGFIDVSAETHAKGTIQTFDYPVFRRGGATTVVRAGNQIYVQNNIEGSIAGNYTVSRIEFVQSLSTTRATLLITDNNGKVFRKSKVEQASRSGKKSSSVAIAEAGLGHGTTYQTATSSGYVPTGQYGTFRYATDGGGGSADVLAFLSDQTSGTPAAATERSSFWTMLSEGDASTNRLIFEPIVTWSSASGFDNYSYIGYHNPIYQTNSGYLYAGAGSAAFPTHSFYASGLTDTGMYSPSDNILGFSAGGVGIYGVWSTPGSPNQGGVYPLEDDKFDMGHLNYKWDDIYATNGTIITSDIRLKENIQPMTLGLDFINDLNPVTYKWKNKKEHKVDQTHYGIIAQEVLETLKKYGIDSIEDFGGVHGKEETSYGARYSEFIPILMKAVQELSAEVKDLKEKI